MQDSMCSTCTKKKKISLIQNTTGTEWQSFTIVCAKVFCTAKRATKNYKCQTQTHWTIPHKHYRKMHNTTHQPEKVDSILNSNNNRNTNNNHNNKHYILLYYTVSNNRTMIMNGTWHDNQQTQHLHYYSFSRFPLLQSSKTPGHFEVFPQTGVVFFQWVSEWISTVKCQHRIAHFRVGLSRLFFQCHRLLQTWAYNYFCMQYSRMQKCT